MNGSPTAQLQAFAQSVYMMIKNRYFDDIIGADGQAYLAQVVDWANMYIDELEAEVTSDGQPIDWIWVRQPGVTLGVATYAGPNVMTPATIPWDPIAYNNLITSEDRFVTPLDSTGQPLSFFRVVNIDDISNDSRKNTEDMCAVTGSFIYFSRPFSQGEDQAPITGDVTTFLPRLVTTTKSDGTLLATNVDIFNTVKPLTLLKLGTAKNAILPDIVKGGLQPSYVQKYNDLLTNAINRSTASAVSPTAETDDFQLVHGVGF